VREKVCSEREKMGCDGISEGESVCVCVCKERERERGALAKTEGKV